MDFSKQNLKKTFRELGSDIKSGFNTMKVGFLGLIKGEDIDVTEETETEDLDYNYFSNEEKEEILLDKVITDITEINGIGEKKAELLRENGFETIQDLQEAEIEDLTKIKGIGKKTAEQLIFDSQDI